MSESSSFSTSILLTLQQSPSKRSTKGYNKVKHTCRVFWKSRLARRLAMIAPCLVISASITLLSLSVLIPEFHSHSMSNPSNRRRQKMLDHKPGFLIENAVQRGFECMTENRTSDEFWSQMSDRILRVTHNPHAGPVTRISILIGAMKAGTGESRIYFRRVSSFLSYLQTPWLSDPLPSTLVVRNEMHYLEKQQFRYNQTCEQWRSLWDGYSERFSNRKHEWYPGTGSVKSRRSLIWEKTPEYAVFTEVAVMIGVLQRLISSSNLLSQHKHNQKQLRVWYLVRNPTKRFYSQYWHRHRVGDARGFASITDRLLQQANSSRRMSRLIKSISKSEWSIREIVESYAALRDSDTIHGLFGADYALRRGMYACHVLTYLSALGLVDYRTAEFSDTGTDPQTFRVVQSERQWKQTHRVTKDVVNWIYGTPQLTGTSLWFRSLNLVTEGKPHQKHPPPLSETVAKLDAFYAPFNRLFYQIWHRYRTLITFKGHDLIRWE